MSLSSKEAKEHIEDESYEKNAAKGGVHIGHVQDIKETGDVKKIIHARNAHSAAAVEAGGLNPWSRESLILYWCAFVAFLCSCANGYDGSLMTGINGMQPYIDRFTDGTNLGEGTGIIFSMYNVGGIIGPFFAGPTTDKFGRRGGMFAGGLLICLGTAIISSAAHVQQFIAGRFILGFGISFMTCAAPSYVIEIAPPQWRGKFTAFYNCGWFGGCIPASAIVLGCAKIKTDWAWRLPLIFQAVPSIVVMASVWFLPESPRWYMSNDRDEDAMNFLVKYHGNGHRENPIVQLEWKEFKDNIKLDASDKRWWDYSELIKTHSARWRILMVVLMGTFGQFSGNGLGYFNLSIYEAVGYDVDMRFILNLVNNILCAIGALTGVALSDRMPRRKVLVIGTFLSAFWLAINGGLSKVWADNAAKNVTDLNVGRGAVAAYFFFGIVYSFAYTPLQALYPVECLDNATRAKGMAMYGVVVGLLGFINTFCTPIALKNIKYNFIFIFVGWDIIESVVWYFFAVETVGRTLEELAEVFEAPNPVKASIQKQTVAIKADGAAVLVDNA